MVVRNPSAGETVDPFGVSPYTLDEVWALTRRLSPRADVRVASRAASGEILNEYDRLWPLAESAPTTTWAMLLADDDLRYRYLCFDFDTNSGNARRDAERMAYWLSELNVPHLLCISGPSGGRHIWVRLLEPEDAHAVREVALLAKSLLPSLDPQPLLNPAAGCVRPPYAPHRTSGYSNPVGDHGAISEHSAPDGFLDQLHVLLGDLGAELPAPQTALPHGITVDEDGQLRLRGARRPLSMKMEAVLHGPAGTDTSHTLARVLIACADARWGYRDIAELLPTAPSLEHARTRRIGDRRVARTTQQVTKVLTAAWRYAVAFVASNPRKTAGDDAGYRDRVSTVTAAVQKALARADALPGLWATHNGRVGGTHSQRAVLDALCLYMLQSAQHVVEADVRRLAADTGYGRTTVHTALRALAQDDMTSPWIERVGEPEGPHAQRYRLHPRFSTEELRQDRTQARMRANHDLHPLYRATIREIGTRLELLAHDVFAAPRSLGRTNGLLYKLTPENGVSSTSELTLRSGVSPEMIRRRLSQLSAAGLISREDGGWRRLSPTVRDFVARRLDVDGYLAERRRRYDEERLIWAWWQAEITWMEKKAKHRRGRRPTHFESDRADYAAYPRGPTRRADHAQAARLVKAGFLERGLALAA